VSTKIEEIQVLFQRRNARKRGPTSSDQFNDMTEEIAHDLATLNEQWNNRLVPLTSALPDGVTDSDVDIYTNGLDGGNLYVDYSASRVLNSTYYNTVSSRPNTVLEQFDTIYSLVNTIRDDLENQISSTVLTAIQIPVTDALGLYQSSNSNITINDS
jgi:hypothetical protein